MPLSEMVEATIWQHRCADGVGGCTAISETFLAELVELVNKLRQPGWCWNCGHRMGHFDGCPVESALRGFMARQDDHAAD